MKMVTHVGRMHAGMVVECLVCVCVGVCTCTSEISFVRQSLDVKSGILLSQDSNGFLGNWEVVISGGSFIFWTIL